MAHEILEHDKQQGRVMAWHGLTEVIENLNLTDCYLREWDVIPVEMKVDGIETPFKILTSVAEDGSKILVGKPFNDASYSVVNNEVFLKMIEEAIAGADMDLESCGSLFNRNRTFVSLGFKSNKFDIEHRSFEAFLNFGNSFDGSCPVWVNTSNICTVCNNTFSANLHDQTNKAVKLRVKHTKNALITIDNMAEIIQSAIHVQEEFAQQFRSLMEQKADTVQAEAWFTGFLVPEGAEEVSTRTANTIETLVSLFKTGNGNEGKNWADVFSAITDYYTHESSGGDDKWKQFVSSEFGAGNTKKQAAWTAIVNPKFRAEIIKRGKSF